MSHKLQSFGDKLTDNSNEDNNEIKVLRKRLAELESTNANIKSEFDALKQLSEDSNAKADKYYKLLEEERAERNRIESEALHMLKDVKNKYEEELIHKTINKLKDKNRSTIQKLKNDYEIKINELESELNETKAQLEYNKDEAKCYSEELNAFKVKTEDNKNKFVAKESVEALKRDYEKRIADKVNECKQRLNDMKKDCDLKINKLMSDYEKIQKELKLLRDENDLIKNKYEMEIKTKTKDNESQSDWNCDQNKPNRWHQQKDAKVEDENDWEPSPETKSKDNESVAALKKRIEELVNELNKQSEDTVMKRVAEMTAQYKEDVTIAKLDLRIAKREADKNQDQIKYYREGMREIKKEKEELQQSIESEKQINQTKDQQIEELQREIKRLQSDIKEKEDEHRSIKDSLEEKIKSLENDSKALKRLESDESNWMKKYEECNQRNEQLFRSIQHLETKSKTLEIELNSKKSECEQKEAVIKKLKNTSKVLQETCSQIEKQAEQFRTKYEGLGEQKQKLLIDKNDTASEFQRIYKESEVIKTKLKEALNEKQQAYNRLELEQSEYEKQIETERQKLSSLKQEYEKECQKSRDYEEKLSVQERNLYSSDETISSLDAKVSYLEEHLIAIKEEAAHHITAIANLKDSNQRLTIAFEDSVEKVESLQDRIDKLHHQLDIKEDELNHEKITTQETMSQQLKLIDFLQNKIESLEKQKKPLFSITPTKKNVNSPRYCPIEFKDLDRALAEEKTKNRRLNEELYKIKSEANYYKTEVLQLKQSIKSDELSSDNELFRKPFDLINQNNAGHDRHVQIESQNDKLSANFQRMHHNIPHRLAEVTNKLNTRCVSCAETIHIGRKTMRCNECRAVSHPKCAENLPNNCGLPVELLQHFFHNSNDINDHYFEDILNGEEQDVVEVQELEPSAPEANSPINNCHSSDSSATTDNNESDSGAFMSHGLETNENSDIREIEAICTHTEEEGFSFTDSMIEALDQQN